MYDDNYLDNFEGLYIIDKASNKIVDEISTNEAYKKYNVESLDRKHKYYNAHYMKFESQETFVKLWDNIIPFLSKRLSPSELKLVITLANHVTSEDCVLRLHNRITSKPMTIKDISELTNYKYDSCRKIVKRLISKGVLAKVNVGQLYSSNKSDNTELFLVNPYIYFRGINVNKTVLKIFEKSGWNIDEERE